ncbi:beta-phosphoglucomutase family hydrolase [Micromonospora sp. WMMA1363]|uniref:beta-phosphoglucomutase family hydrolase n=1 Tax=Micromonospora sp. WMMA1363 TaxID=3053985 RepID=UPI00259CDE3C|nr:beta-phosphoglucomutase family hydrolase [Micromonospora sp. WMMA1363]MDM4722251.1 beta-phosphoglucomutase family hydrolase [Micromonospora sp. WMMA1363]
MLGLPAHVTACLFDLDGVLTQTARVHNAAWTATFDEFLRRWAALTGEPFRPFDPGADYNRYVDGRPRHDGVRTFLASRGIVLPEGEPDAPPAADTVVGVGNRKNVLFLEELRTHGVDVYPGSVAYLEAAAAAGLRRAVVTASANGREVIAAAGLEPLLEIRVDGLVARTEGLRGKPEPDTFLAGAKLLGVDPADAVVFEDALAGVAAGRAGGFGYVVGVDRVGQADELLEYGADVVIRDLAELLDRDPAGPGRAETGPAREPSRLDRGPVVRNREPGA